MVAFEKMFCSESSKDSHPQGPPCWRQLLKWLGWGVEGVADMAADVSIDKTVAGEERGGYWRRQFS